MASPVRCPLACASLYQVSLASGAARALVLQEAEVVADDVVTFARRLFQPEAVLDGHLAPVIAD